MEPQWTDALADRVLYGTDNVLYPSDKTDNVLRDWAATYARDWRYYAGDADVTFEQGTTKGLHLPEGRVAKAVSRQRGEVVSGDWMTGPARSGSRVRSRAFW